MATTRPDGRTRLDQLPRQAFLAGWPTPNAGPQNDQDSRWAERRAEVRDRHGNGSGFGLTLGMASQLAGWPTPTAADGRRGIAPPRPQDTGLPLSQAAALVGPARLINGLWRNADWLLCRDPDGPRWRPVEPGAFPLADGPPARMVRLRGYGNAINAAVAAGFIAATVDAFGLDPLGDPRP